MVVDTKQGYKSLLMQCFKLEEMIKGWVVGKFTPSVMEADFEVGVQTHEKGYVSPLHLHKKFKEINVIVSGSMTVNGRKLKDGDIFVFDIMEVSEAEFHEDTTLVVIRPGSDPNDKYNVELSQ